MRLQADIYKSLRKHLDGMPIGYPATRSGVELRILKRLFTPEEAIIALAMTHHFEPAETILARTEKNGMTHPAGQALLDGMAAKGSIFGKTAAGIPCFGLIPFVVGMFEFQLHRMTPEFYEDTAQYFREAFGLAYLSTPLPQMRVIPIEQSLTQQHRVATYDEIRHIIEQAGDKIGVATCICRKGKDLSGDPCKKTDRREVCFGFRDYFDFYREHGWLRPVNTGEALEILHQSEKEGLVLQATNEQKPQAVCACCGCCCGVLNTLKSIPNGADFVAGYYRCRINRDACVGCGICADRCQVNAISMEGKKAAINLKRCIGCGVCVPACKPGALTLEHKENPVVPPETTEALYDILMARKSRWDRVRTAAKVLRQMSVKEIRGMMGI